MIEEKEYTLQELQEYLRTERPDSIMSKLQTLECEYEKIGRGNNVVFRITKVPNRIKEICIYNLGIPPQTDFEKLKWFFYFYFENEEFRTLPYKAMERKLELFGKPIARQTFGKWINSLEEANLIMFDEDDCNYYASGFDNKGVYYCYPSNEEFYKEAWCKFWRDMNRNEGNYAKALFNMKQSYLGKALKRPKPKENALTYSTLEALKNAVNEEVAKEL